MEQITFEALIKKVEDYNPEAVELVKKAYYYAETYHRGQYRESGEEYITHPLNVAYILADMNADADTICAGLLHDILEDTKATKEDIAHDFNQDIANLVDGVTKLSKMNFSSKESQNYANTRKILTGITNDVRIIIIKLADRLHNMRTLEHKTPLKQKENAMETMEIFVPLAYSIGAYRIKSELEDISFKYLYPEIYKRLEDQKQRIEEDSTACIEEMISKIKRILEDKEIPNEIKRRTKNIYGIYRRLKEENKLSDIHDLLALKIMVDDVDDCYRTLGAIHSIYHPLNEKFKDYISNPKTNMYRSLHTTVFGPDERLVQTQIRTFDMDNIASHGLTAYWAIEKGDARARMQEDLKSRYQFFKSLIEINKTFGDNREFVNQVKEELFRDKIYVYTTMGKIIELPKGATAIDLAYALGTDIGNTMVSAEVNGKVVLPEQELHNKDRVKIITDMYSFGSRNGWLTKAKTTHAKRAIARFQDGD